MGSLALGPAECGVGARLPDTRTGYRVSSSVATKCGKGPTVTREDPIFKIFKARCLMSFQQKMNAANHAQHSKSLNPNPAQRPPQDMSVHGKGQEGVRPSHRLELTPLLCVEDVAQFLSVRKGYVYDLVAEANLPMIKVGKYLRISQQSLLEWISAQGNPGNLPGRHIDRP